MELSWLTDDARTFLKRGYLRDQTPEERYEQICDTILKISKIKDIDDRFRRYISNGWVSFASPVLSNFGHAQNLPISCNFSKVMDNLDSILNGLREVGMLSKYGAGIAVNFSAIRPIGSKISSGGKSEGIMPFIEIYDHLIDRVSQNGVRRGFLTAYLKADHPEIFEFLDIGTEGHKVKTITSAVTIPKGWMESLKNGDAYKRKIWSKILKRRSETGFPYILFEENCNINSPQVYRDKNMWIDSSNICIECQEYCDAEKTFACCLSSVNLIHRDDWKTDSDFIFDMNIMLDCVIEEYIQKGSHMAGLKRAIKFAKEHRAIGLGVLGFHSLLQKKQIAIGSLESFSLNNEIFKHLREESDRASAWMAKEWGEPEIMKTYGLRNSSRIAVAPTKSCAVASTTFLDGFGNTIDYYEFCNRGNLDLKNILKIEISTEEGVFYVEHNLQIEVQRGDESYIVFARDLKEDDIILDVVMGKRKRNLYKSWSKYLSKSSVTPNKLLFISNFDLMSFKKCTPGSILFFLERYGWLLSPPELEELHKEYLLESNNKRGSIYDIDNIIFKQGASRSEAEKLVEERKNKTSGTLNNFIRRHGEESGRIKFQEFKEKSSSTLENFIKRYGGEGEEKWTAFLQSRDTASLESYIKRFGKEEGIKLFDLRQENFSKYHTLEGNIEIYGKKEGTKKYEKLVEGKTVNLCDYIEKHGEELGVKKYEEMRLKKSYGSSLDYVLKKYGEVEGKQVYADRVMKQSPIYSGLLNHFNGDTEKAKEAYLVEDSELIEKQTKKVSKKLSKYIKNTKGPVSKIATNFFDELQSRLGRSLMYGAKKDELKIFKVKDKRSYFYDCYDGKSNSIIEFHGSAFHPRNGDTEWVGAFGSSYDSQHSLDIKKEKAAIDLGYNFIVVWDQEVKTLVNKEKTILKLIGELNEN